MWLRLLLKRLKPLLSQYQITALCFVHYFFFLPFLASPLLPALCRCWGLLLHLITLDDTRTHTLDRTPLEEGSVRHRDLYLTRRRIYKRNTSMPLAGFEPPIPSSDRLQTFALDRAATRIGRFMYSHSGWAKSRYTVYYRLYTIHCIPNFGPPCSNNAFEFCTESTPLRSYSENERRMQGLLSVYVDNRPSVIIPNPCTLLCYMSRPFESLHLSLLGRCMFYLLRLEASCSVRMAML